MRLAGRSCRALFAAALFASLVAPAGASAEMRATTIRRQKIGLAQARTMSMRARAALIGDDEDDATEFITGKVTPNGGMWEDAFVWVAAIYYDSEEGYWYLGGAGEVKPDGTYKVGLWDGPGTYRVGFLDDGNVYKDVFYLDANTPEDATDIVVAKNQTVPGIDQTLNPLPETMITGRVGFQGAPPPAEGVGIEAIQYIYDEDWGEWYWAGMSFNVSKADGTYRLHLREPGTYKVGYWDWTGAFNDVLYHDKQELTAADDVIVAELGGTVAGIDQTMTANPSDVVAGENRYATAVEVSRAMYPDSEDEDGGYYVGTAVLATGEDWPDALVASSLAGVNGGPLLLTRRNGLPSETLRELQRLNPYEVIIVGGYDAVSLAAEVNLRLGTGVPKIRRVCGRDRYETAAMVAQETASQVEYGFGWGESESGYSWTPIVTSGEAFADAMSAGPVSAWMYSPVLLTRRDSLPAATSGWFRQHKVGDTLLVGGSSAVSRKVAGSLPNVTRIGGANRYATACALADFAIEELDMMPQLFGVASGVDFPDGLVAGPALGVQGRCLLLTRPYDIPSETAAFLRGRQGGVAGLRFFGSEAAIAPWVVDEMMASCGLQPLYAGDESWGP